MCGGNGKPAVSGKRCSVDSAANAQPGEPHECATAICRYTRVIFEWHEQIPYEKACRCDKGNMKD